MNDFDKLRQRVKDMGGKVVGTEWGWELDIGDDSFTMFHECDPNAEDIAFWNTYLDGRDAKAKARRCVKHFDKESDIKCFIAEDSTPADLLHCTDVNSKADAFRDAAKYIRREFGIEEAK